MSGQGQGYDSSKGPWQSKKWTLSVYVATLAGGLLVIAMALDTVAESAPVLLGILGLAGVGAAGQAWVDQRNAGQRR